MTLRIRALRIAFGRSHRRAAARCGAMAAAALAFAASATSASAGEFPTTVKITSCPSVSIAGFIGDFPQPGAAAGQMRQFLGVPYAAPPVGANRWNAPQPFCPAVHTLKTKAFANRCPQPESAFGVASSTEDCLYLNIFTPVESGKYPVMVWLHGGGLTVQETGDYNPIELVNRGVIVVTIEYRLGALGFLAHPALDDVSVGNTGNYGIEDQQAALKWVKENIAAFGGEPTKVTVFGQSAGGISTLVHLVSPKSAGLFSGAIIHSGVLRVPLTDLAPLSTAESAGVNFANAVGCSTAACLRGLSVSTILANQGAIDYPGFGGPLPNIDNFVLTDTVQNLLASGTFNKVPVINGTNHDEWRLNLPASGFGTLTTSGPHRGNFADSLTPDALAASQHGIGYTQALSDLGFSNAAIGQIESVYPGGSTDAAANTALTAVVTDKNFACSAIHADSLIAQANVPIFAYEFNDERAPQNFYGPMTTLDGKNFPFGAFHIAELQYLFPISNPTGVGFDLNKKPLDAAQATLATAMATYWTTFAKTGNPNPKPNPSKLANWPTFSHAALLSLVPATPTTETAASFNSAHHCSFWAPDE